MTIQTGSNNYAVAVGTAPENVEIPHVDVRDPSSTDVNYPIGKRWIDSVGNSEWTLTSLSSAGGTLSATWTVSGGGSKLLSTLTTDDSVVVVPVAGNINLKGSGSTTTVGSGNNATVELTGLTNHAVLVGAGTTTITKLAVGTDGQVLTGNSAADPAFAAIGTKSGLTAHGVVIAEGSGAFAATAAGGSGLPLVGQGAADPIFTVLGVAGGGTGASTFTAHGVLVGEGTGPISPVTGATGQVLVGVTGADPSFTGSPSLTGAITAGTTLTATLGNITATNGDFVASTAGTGVVLGGGAKVVSGTGDPNTVVTAPQGSLYLRLDGSSFSTRAYINSDSATAWVAVTTAS